MDSTVCERKKTNQKSKILDCTEKSTKDIGNSVIRENRNLKSYLNNIPNEME